ncbi:unnamed protein product [Dovyalis caffra]|uniref:Uncharacterized protein n=1 Tax=Dovyalis caffra TaxID=77055 RepID=A0AAV1RU58_9ROSI|nr:unnamed protein product [Dovyalis caffra]
MAGGIPICVQCGTTSNPCRCKVVGPTVGFLAFAAAAVVEWPLGAFVYLFKRMKGRRIMAHPAAVVYPRHDPSQWSSQYELVLNGRAHMAVHPIKE